MTSTGGEYEHVLYEVRDGVAHLILNRPEKLNALGVGPGSNREEIERALAAADADDEVGAVLISANGRAFCAGGDLTRTGRVGAQETALDHHLFNERMIKFYSAIRGTHKPVIAAVHGYCLGAGLGFTIQCDLVIAADDAKFGLIEGRIGHPGATDLVPIIGTAWTKFLILTGEMISAERAEKIGLVLTVLPRDQLLSKATDLAERMARMPREAALLNKASVEAMTEIMGRGSARMIGRSYDTVTRTMSHEAKAPDGRLFDAILKEEGMDGMKRARDSQYKEPWL